VPTQTKMNGGRYAALAVALLLTTGVYGQLHTSRGSSQVRTSRGSSSAISENTLPDGSRKGECSYSDSNGNFVRMSFSFEADNRNPRFTLLEGDTDLTMAETYRLCRRYNDELNSQPINPLNNLHVQLNNPFNNLHIQPINPLDNLHDQPINPLNNLHVQPIDPLHNLHIQPINPLNDLHISISSGLPITHSSSLPSDAVDLHHTILQNQLNPMDHVQRMMREHQRIQEQNLAFHQQIQDQMLRNFPVHPFGQNCDHC